MSNENRLNDFSEDFDSEELENADSIDELPHNRKDEKELDERNKVYTKILNNYKKSYNLDTKKWTALSNEKASNWQTWYPKKGNYWIYVEATLPNGYKTNQVMCFAVGRNY